MTQPVSMPAGHEIIAPDMDAYEQLTAFWTPYTPAWSASGTAPALGNGALNGRYKQAGKWLQAAIFQSMGSTTTFGTGAYSWSLPVPSTSLASFGWVGSGYFRDASAGGTGHFAGACMLASTTTLNGLSGNALVGQLAPFTWVNTDFLMLFITYEAA